METQGDSGEERRDEASRREEVPANAGGRRPPAQADFLQFISSMFAQTLVHLGSMSNPLTNKVEVDLVNARYSIDLLAVLQEKTNGNLTAEEEEYLRNILYQLRMTYVRVTKQGAAAADAKSQERHEGESASANGADDKTEARA